MILEPNILLTVGHLPCASCFFKERTIKESTRVSPIWQIRTESPFHNHRSNKHTRVTRPTVWEDRPFAPCGRTVIRMGGMGRRGEVTLQFGLGARKVSFLPAGSLLCTWKCLVFCRARQSPAGGNRKQINAGPTRGRSSPAQNSPSPKEAAEGASSSPFTPLTTTLIFIGSTRCGTHIPNPDFILPNLMLGWEGGSVRRSHGRVCVRQIVQWDLKITPCDL